MDVYTTDWQGDIPAGFNVQLCSSFGLSNHGRMRSFHKSVERKRKQSNAQCLVGFNKMPGLDFYYGADSSIKQSFEQKYGAWFRITSRYRTYVGYERAVFVDPDGPKLLMISESQKAEYQKLYQVAEERFVILPPGLAADRVRPSEPEKIRQKLREYNGVSDNDVILLMVASAFKTKGLDRAIEALASLSGRHGKQSYLWVVGHDHQSSYQQQANTLGIGEQLLFLGERDNVLEYMEAADLLIHPARKEAAGNVLLEAMLTGLPVLTTDVCGFAMHIENSVAGKVLDSPFSQRTLNDELLAMLDINVLKKLGQNALAYCETQDFYSRAHVAVDCLEKFKG